MALAGARHAFANALAVLIAMTSGDALACGIPFLDSETIGFETLPSDRGYPFSDRPGEVVLAEAPIRVRLQTLAMGSQAVFGELNPQDPDPLLFPTRSALLNGIALEFDFSQPIGRDLLANAVSFDYVDLGSGLSVENLEVNGQNVQTGNLAALPDTIGGASVEVAETPSSSSGTRGRVTISGEVSRFVIGGEQLVIDDVQSVFLDECPGDFTGDKLIDRRDYFLWAATYGGTDSWAADGTWDGRVDAADYTLWRDRLTLAATHSVPEPTAIAAAAPILLCFLASGLRRQHRREGHFAFTTRAAGCQSTRG